MLLRRLGAAWTRLIALLILSVGAGSAWLALAPPRQTAAQVRALLWEEVRAGRFGHCDAHLAWLADHDRIAAEDLMVQARVSELRGRFDQAVSSLARLDPQSPYRARAKLMLGQIELRRDRARAAEAALLAALDCDPGLVAARLELIRIYSRQLRRRELNQHCRALANQNALDFEHLRFWSLTRNVPWNPEGDLKTLRRGVEADPEDRASRLALAEGFRRMGRGEESEAIMAPLPESDLDARALRARIAMDRGEMDLAARLLALATESHAGLAQLRGQLALSRRDFPMAIHHFRIARDLDTDDRSNQAGLQTALRLAGGSEASPSSLYASNHFEAIDALIARLGDSNADSDAELLRQMGSACETLGRQVEARAWYQLAVARDPLNSDAQRDLFRLTRPPATISTAASVD